MIESVLAEVRRAVRLRADVRVPWFYIRCFVYPLVALVGYWAWFIRGSYHPSEDEFALIVNSTRMFHPVVKSWFLNGFGQYFMGYPGLSQPATDFVRPVVNAVYWLNSAVWGQRWAYYLLVTYAAQAGLVWVSMKLAVEAGRVPRWLVKWVGVLVFVSPAFGWQQMFLTSFTFDLLGAFFVMLALHEIWHRRYLRGWLLVVLAVFTKETTLFAPVLLAGMVWMPQWKIRVASRRVAWTLAWLAPVGAWMMVRHMAFGGHAGVYVLHGAGLRGELPGVLHGFLSWPFGTRTARQSVLVRWFYFPLNTAFWAGCVAATVQWNRARRQGVGVMEGLIRGRRRGGVTEALILLSAGALAMPLLLNLPVRFGGCFYPLFFLLLAKMVWLRDGISVRLGALFCMAAALGTALYQKAVDPWRLGFARSEWALAGSYVNAIRASNATTLLLVDDASGAFTSPELVARFAGYKGTLVRANNVEVLDPSKCQGSPRVGIQGGLLESAVTPPCGFYTFDSVPPERIGGEMVSSVGGVSVKIMPPEAKELPRSGTLGMYGELRVSASGPVSVMVPDLGAKVYREVR